MYYYCHYYDTHSFIADGVVESCQKYEWILYKADVRCVCVWIVFHENRSNDQFISELQFEKRVSTASHTQTRTHTTRSSRGCSATAKCAHPHGSYTIKLRSLLQCYDS